MKAVEFEIEFTGGNYLPLPAAIAQQLPTRGPARVIILFDGETAPRTESIAATELFAREDSPEDTIYGQST